MPKIVLVAPEIPFNTGAIGRTCVALDIELILIKPYGFSLDEKSVARLERAIGLMFSSVNMTVGIIL